MYRKTFIIFLLVLCCPVWGQTVVGSDKVHVVAEGETLDGLAHQYGLAPEHLSFANNLPLQRELVGGTSLTIPLRRILPSSPPADGLVLNLPERGLYLFRHGRFEKFYPLAIGRPDYRTPIGSYKVISKSINPTWYPPPWAGLGSIAVPPGAKNPLGTRWIGLTAGGGAVGIHGTTSPSSIGMAVSHGCLRMYPDQVEELYDKVWIGMPVRIEYEPLKKSGDLVVAFPDIYGIKSAAAVARKLGLATAPALTGRVARANGEPIQVVIGDLPLELAAPVRLMEGRLWASKEMLATLGLNVSWEVASKSVLVNDGVRSAAYPPGQVRRQGDQVLLPVTEVLKTFGIAHEYAEAEKVLRLSPTVSSTEPEAETEWGSGPVLE